MNKTRRNEKNGPSTGELERQLDLYRRKIRELQAQVSHGEKLSDTISLREEEISYFKGLVQDQTNSIDAIRNGVMWRCTRPFRRLGKKIRRLFSKNNGFETNDWISSGRVAFKLTAVHELELDVALRNHWRSLGDDPFFHLVPHRSRSFRGWHMVEFMVTGSLPHALARFYFDDGNGYSERRSITIPYRNGQLTKRLYRFDTAPVGIRFDPMESKGYFRIDHLDFVKVPGWFAVNRMLRKIRSTHDGYLGKSIPEVREGIKRQAREDGIEFVDAADRLYSQYFKASTMSYEEWIETVEKPVFSDFVAIEKSVEHFSPKPLISVIVPVYNTRPGFLRRCIESVIGQSYSHWQLCIADDASTNAAIGETLPSYARSDERIKVVRRRENGHISAASNSALQLATGDYVALLDHDDELAEHALFFVAKAISENPQVKTIYTDEDKIDESGRRSDPHFKSDWNPDLLLSQNYISHLGVYHRDMVEAIGGFRLGVEGSQDFDLLLRCAGSVDGDEIVHIPQVLYHWRSTEGSTAQAAHEKSYTTEAGIKALEHIIHIQELDAHVTQGMLPNTYRMIHRISDPEPLVSLIIPTRDGYEVLSRCISSIRDKTTYDNYEILIVDNQSRDPETLDYLSSIQDGDRLRVVPFDHSFNFSAINNYGVGKAKGNVLGLINNDVEVITPDWLTEMVSHALRPKRGCVGAKLYYPDGRIQHAGVILGIGGVAGHSHKYFNKSSPGYFSRLMLVQNISAVTAACLVVRKKIYQQVEGLDEKNLTVAFNDVDFCLKVHMAGYKNVWTPYAELIHHESISRGGEDSTEKIDRFNRETQFMKEKWKTVLPHDPYYSPHLSMEKEDFSIGGKICFP